MTVSVPAKPERRQLTHQLIAELQNERRQVWSLYCQVADLKPFTTVDAVRSTLTRFSQLLVDYVSLGHFGLYERLLAGTERRDRVLSVAKDIYPEFSSTTEATILFNDKYEKIKKISHFDDLEKDLSDLGERLAKRFDLEDKLCELMRQ
jgi:regulator of sigma D